MNKFLILLWMAVSSVAQGQLLPQLQLPQLPVQLPQEQLSAVAAPDLRQLRSLRIREILRRNPRELTRDPRGEPIVRGVFLALSPSENALEAARRAGFTVQREQVLEGLDARVVTLLAPAGWSPGRGLTRLRALDPGGSYDFNHLYFESGTEQAGAAMPAAIPPSAPRAGSSFKVGLIDGGVAADHPVFSGVAIQVFGCDGLRIPSAHGTAVASLLVGREGDFHGAAPGIALYAADIYCGSPVGGQVEAVLPALAWLARERVPVVNISLVGPRNVVLEGVVRTLIARGIVIVAAVGNDGPAAAPLYPASYEGVIGVTAVDARDKTLLEAARGPQVDLAAPGADIVAATLGDGYAPVRGTSFAAPLVAGLLARDQSVATLFSSARDLGPPGPDTTYGSGLVGADLRASLRKK